MFYIEKLVALVMMVNSSRSRHWIFWDYQRGFPCWNKCKSESVNTFKLKKIRVNFASKCMIHDARNMNAKKFLLFFLYKKN